MLSGLKNHDEKINH